MIYSKWNQDGTFDYFETNERFNIGDDLPTPFVPESINDIGSPAQEVGRNVPVGARRIGSGRIPKGLMSPMISSSTSLSGGDQSPSSLGDAAVVLFASSIIFFSILAWSNRKALWG